jgi:hypothetical protein
MKAKGKAEKSLTFVDNEIAVKSLTRMILKYFLCGASSPVLALEIEATGKFFNMH